MNAVSKYKDVKSQSQRGLVRKLMRDVTLDALSLKTKLTTGFTEAFQRNRIQFLYIHHLFEDEKPKFRKLLSLLSENHTFITYSAAVKLILEGKIDKPYIVFSSDDGFKNNLNVAEILNEYNASCCFFVIGALINETDMTRISRFNQSVLKFPPVEYLSWKDLEKLKKQGHEIGGHTMNHVNLGSVPSTLAEDEIAESFQVLKSLFGEELHFAWPYGKFSDITEEVKDFIFSSGFISCASAVRGAHISGAKGVSPQDLCIRRDHLILDWPLAHIKYFLANSSRSASEANNLFFFQT